jgi:AraC family transcriptional regulator of arabinose operon
MRFYHILSIRNSSLLHINNIGCSDNPSNNRFGPGKRDIWLIHYVTKGKGYFNENPVVAGQGFLINRGQLEKYYPDTQAPWEFLWVTSDDDRMKMLFEKYPIDPKTQIFNYNHISVIKNAMAYIKSHHQTILTDEEILEMFLHIFNQHHHAVEKRTSNADIYLNFSVQYIKNHIHAEIKINDLANTIGISSTYLLEIFKNKLGVSPKQYLNNLRLTTAKKMLSETDMSVTQIARSVGYDDVLTFSRFFKSHEKQAPSTYRNIQKN